MYAGLLRDLEKLLGSGSVLFHAEDVLLYEYDGSVEKGRPDLVVFPTSTGPFDNSFGNSKLCALQRISLLENT